MSNISQTTQPTAADVQGFEMTMIICKYCRRPQMEVTRDANVVIKWKCRSCRNWLACKMPEFKFLPTR